MFDGIEEVLVIVWEEPRIWQACLSKHMVSKEYFMKQAVSELRVGGSFKEGSDEES